MTVPGDVLGCALFLIWQMGWHSQLSSLAETKEPQGYDTTPALAKSIINNGYRFMSAARARNMIIRPVAHGLPSFVDMCFSNPLSNVTEVRDRVYTIFVISSEYVETQGLHRTMQPDYKMDMAEICIGVFRHVFQ